jgi:hypothetical protein
MLTLDDVYEELLTIVSERGARVDVPIESERFFSRLVEGFQGTREQLIEYVRANVPRWFRWTGQPPEWIQDAEWQFTDDGRPMVFLGQVDVPARSGILHDDGRVYVFIDPKGGEVKTITQVA